MAKKKRPPRGPQIKLSGDVLCVAFVNTEAARSGNDQQGVESYADLLTWGQQTDLLSALDAKRLERLAAERPAEATAVYDRAARLRGALVKIFIAAIKEEEMPSLTTTDLVQRGLRPSCPQSGVLQPERPTG